MEKYMEVVVVCFRHKSSIRLGELSKITKTLFQNIRSPGQYSYRRRMEYEVIHCPADKTDTGLNEP
jgi:hypothetical protein